MLRLVIFPKWLLKKATAKHGVLLIVLSVCVPCQNAFKDQKLLLLILI